MNHTTDAIIVPVDPNWEIGAIPKITIHSSDWLVVLKEPTKTSLPLSLKRYGLSGEARLAHLLSRDVAALIFYRYKLL